MQEAFSNSDLETQHCLQKVRELETIADHMMMAISAAASRYEHSFTKKTLKDSLVIWIVIHLTICFEGLSQSLSIEA